MAKALSTKVDFSYKKNALRVTYDFECTRDIFTAAFIHDKAMSLMIFANEQFDDVSDEDLLRQIEDFAKKPSTLKFMKKSSHEEIGKHLYRYRMGDDLSLLNFRRDLTSFCSCRVLPHDMQYTDQHEFVEYGSWNGSRYDVMLAILITMIAKIKGRNLTPSDLRDMSNLIIKYDGRPYKFYEFVEKETNGLISSKELRMRHNSSIWADGHIDWAKLAKSDETSGEERLFPPALKKEMARDGMDIIIDENVADDNHREWSLEEKEHLVDYNFNDVLGTKVKSETEVVSGMLKTRDLVREMYPYTSARAVSLSDLRYVSPPERDTTAATLAGLVLIGPNKKKPQDYEAVDFTFPVPDGKGGEKNVDLWEYVKSKEKFIPNELDVFFSHFRGKDTRSHKDNNAAKYSQPINHSAVMPLPYYRDGQPTDSVITVSTGGAHSFIKAGLRLMKSHEVLAWMKASGPVTIEEKATIDVKDCIHIDWSSFYPVMASKMKMYITSDGVDRYTGIIERRITIKNALPQDYNAWTKEHVKINEDQGGLKFVLNNATGAGNQHNPYALLPVDNKTLSMRLIGNMHIWVLGQRLTQAGAFVISTNTDGLYITGISMELAKEIVDGYVKDYGMDVEPERLGRFINRDTSNRVEFNTKGERNKVGGRLRHAHKPYFTEHSLGQNIPYPLIAANAALEYMNQEDWLQKPYDPTVIRNYIQEMSKDPDLKEAWYHVYVGSGSRQLTIDGIPQQRINRLVMTETGKQFGTIQSRALTKAAFLEFYDLWYSGLSLNEIAIKLNQSHKGKFFEVDSDEAHQKMIKFNDEILQCNHQNSEVFFGKKRKKYNEEIVERQRPITKDLDVEQIYSQCEKGSKLFIQRTDIDDAQPIEIKAWSHGDKLTGYPSRIGRSLNTADELESLDLNDLDLDAYIAWAEDLLSGWKITADIPDVGMISIDDTVVENKSKKRMTKAETQIEMLKNIYLGLNTSDISGDRDEDYDEDCEDSEC